MLATVGVQVLLTGVTWKREGGKKKAAELEWTSGCSYNHMQMTHTEIRMYRCKKIFAFAYAERQPKHSYICFV